jgi:putative spermidine/putrescine transport system ATP-binding protein
MPNTGTTSPNTGNDGYYDRDEGLAIQDVTFRYRTNIVLQNLCLSITPGTFTVLLGSSGCGKTTLLRLIAGHLQPQHGSIHLAGRDLTHLPAEQRNIGMVYQNYALFPHLDARANVAFGLEMRRLPRSEITSRVEAILDRVGLPADARARKPEALSGGQQQRVALARALVIEPDLLLLDEPLAHLDRQLREQMRQELRTGTTTLMVTHDPDDALALADQVGVMEAGRLVQWGSPRELYDRPIHARVAALLGAVNLLPGGVLVRPERVRLVAGDQPVTQVQYRGSRALVQVAGILAEVDASTAPQVGQRVGLDIPETARWHMPGEQT